MESSATEDAITPLNTDLGNEAQDAFITQNHENVDYENVQKCGIGLFNFPWLQILASKKSFVIVYGLIGTSHFALSTYFVGTISTLEKRFQIPSFYTGLINSACDVGVISTTLTASYLGRSSHKPRWVAWGTALVGLSCFVRLIPHWLFGPGENALHLTEEFSAQFELTNASNTTDRKITLCGNKYVEFEDCESANTGNIAAFIFMIAHAMQGVGSSVYYTLGIAYLDDNARKNKVPVLLAITQCLRMIGPTFGYFLASFALEIYVKPSLAPLITSSDPRWVGAWWLGWAPLGFACLFLAVAMAMFPRSLPRAALRNIQTAPEDSQPNTKISLKDFKETMRRLVKNKVLMYNSISTVCFTFGFLGQWIFLPKYMETQFHRTASDVSFITGSIGLLFTAAGILVSAIVISKFMPNARTLAAWNVFTELLDCLGFVAILFVGCESLQFQGVLQQNGLYSLGEECNSNCMCPESTRYSPVCHPASSATFFSPCHAGCSDVKENSTTRLFENCNCVFDSSSILEGPCSVDCGEAFTIFVIIHCIQRFFGATGRAGNTLIHFRCVSTEDKPVSVGFLEFLLCAFAFIPAPIVFGVLIDMSCSVWGETCGNTGNCWVYDVDKLRHYVNLPILGCLVFGTIWDVGVWFHVKELAMYNDETYISGSKKRENHTALKEFWRLTKK